MEEVIKVITEKLEDLRKDEIRWTAAKAEEENTLAHIPEGKKVAGSDMLAKDFHETLIEYATWKLEKITKDIQTLERAHRLLQP